jgi:hypothetical protein
VKPAPLSAGGLVLDQHDTRVEQALLLAQRVSAPGIRAVCGTPRRSRRLSFTPQVVQTEKSLSSVAFAIAGSRCSIGVIGLVISSKVRFAIDSLLEGAVMSEPVSGAKFPASW